MSIIDDYTFGDLKSFKSQFARLTNDDNFDDLKARLNPVCKRTLRRQVLEYVKYTNRIPVTQEFYPTVMNADGTNPVNLTNNPSSDGEPPGLQTEPRLYLVRGEAAPLIYGL